MKCLPIIVGLVALQLACSKPLDPPPAPAPTITQATFEPVYRAAKSIQGATTAGVTFVQFGQLMQSFATELTIARDKQMNELDKKLHGLFVEAFDRFRLSKSLWESKNDNNEKYFEGMILIPESTIPVWKSYGIAATERKYPYTGAKYWALPEDAMQTMWMRADEVLAQATEMYYGRTATKGTK